jgi:hypothetical protein
MIPSRWIITLSYLLLISPFLAPISRRWLTLLMPFLIVGTVPYLPRSECSPTMFDKGRQGPFNHFLFLFENQPRPGTN